MSSTLDGKTLTPLVSTPVCPAVSTFNLLATEKQIDVDSCFCVAQSHLATHPAV